jgi:hypothetical protein
VTDGTTNAPSCSGGFTGETNSLTLAGPCCPMGGAPAIVFTESTDAGATSICACPGSAWNPIDATCWKPPIKPTDCTVLQECNGAVYGVCYEGLVLNQPGTDSRLLYRSEDRTTSPPPPSTYVLIGLLDTNPPYDQPTWYKTCDSNPGGFLPQCAPPNEWTPKRLTCPPPGGGGAGGGGVEGCYLGGIPVPCFSCQQGPAHPAGCKLQ